MSLEQTICAHASRDWIDFLQALSTPIVALFVALIGFAQWWTARNKFKLDLFDRRWKIWDAICNTIGTIIRESALTRDEEIKFLEDVRGARWLVNDSVDRYIKKELWRQMCALKSANRCLGEGMPERLRNEAVEKQSEILTWASKQFEYTDKLFDNSLQMDMPFAKWLSKLWQKK